MSRHPAFVSKGRILILAFVTLYHFIDRNELPIDNSAGGMLTTASESPFTAVTGTGPSPTPGLVSFKPMLIISELIYVTASCCKYSCYTNGLQYPHDFSITETRTVYLSLKNDTYSGILLTLFVSVTFSACWYAIHCSTGQSLHRGVQYIS